MKISLVKDYVSLKPADSQAEEALGQFKRGEIILVEIVKSRNPAHHRKYFALLKVTFDNQDVYKSFDELKAVCLCEIGYCQTFVDKDGTVIKSPKSISFETLDQLEFSDIYERSLDWMANLLGTDPETLEREAE